MSEKHNLVTEQTRREAYEAIKPKMAPRQSMVLELFLSGGEYTVDEAVDKLWKGGLIAYPDRNFVAPRITELLHRHRLEVAGKKKSPRSTRQVAIFRATDI